MGKKEKRVDVSKHKMLLGTNVLLFKTLPFAHEKFYSLRLPLQTHKKVSCIGT
jgi:hypothetical protein